jgi:hypothetical protein
MVFDEVFGESFFVFAGSAFTSPHQADMDRKSSPVEKQFEHSRERTWEGRIGNVLANLVVAGSPFSISTSRPMRG